VIVVELGQTGGGEVLDACAQFESMGTPVLGAVVARYGKDARPEDLVDDDDESGDEPEAGAAEPVVTRAPATPPVPASTPTSTPASTPATAPAPSNVPGNAPDLPPASRGTTPR
jgi:hypothetical protein